MIELSGTIVTRVDPDRARPASASTVVNLTSHTAAVTRARARGVFSYFRARCRRTVSRYWSRRSAASRRKPWAAGRGGGRENDFRVVWRMSLVVLGSRELTPKPK